METYTISGKAKVVLQFGAEGAGMRFTLLTRGSQKERKVGADGQGTKIETTLLMEPDKFTESTAAKGPVTEKPTVTKSYGTLDTLNRMKFSRIPNPGPIQTMDLEIARAERALIFPEFPVEAVTLGSSWEITPPSVRSKSKSRFNISYTLSARDTINGIATVVILARADLIHIGKEKAPYGNPRGTRQIESTQTSKLEGKLWIDPTSGRTLRAELGGTTKLSIDKIANYGSSGEHKTVYIAKL